MKLDHRGLYGAVAKTVFYGLDILSIFQKMCGEGMAEHVSGKLRVKPGTRQSFPKPRAYKMIVDWLVRTETFKYEIHARVTLAIGLQDNQRLARDRDNPVLEPLSHSYAFRRGEKSQFFNNALMPSTPGHFFMKVLEGA